MRPLRAVCVLSRYFQYVFRCSPYFLTQMNTCSIILINQSPTISMLDHVMTFSLVKSTGVFCDPCLCHPSMIYLVVLK